MVTKENLKDYATKLMFDMDDAGYERTLEEFIIIEKQMNLIAKIKGINNVEPMTFPYEIYKATFRDDEVKSSLTASEALSNCKAVKNNEIRVPKVVGNE
ncbi:MAG: hypothetical protein RR847_01870 [Bacilli bacterium]